MVRRLELSAPLSEERAGDWVNHQWPMISSIMLHNGPPIITLDEGIRGASGLVNASCWGLAHPNFMVTEVAALWKLPDLSLSTSSSGH